MKASIRNFFGQGFLRQALLYGLIGAFSASLDYLSFHFFRSLGMPLLLSNFFSINIGITTSFLINAAYNFKKTDRLGTRATIFYSVGYLGIGISSLILYIFVVIGSFDESLVKLVSIFVVAAIQFVLNKTFSFRDFGSEG